MKILIKTGSFCVDGHTKVLRDVLIGLDKKKFDILLAVENDFGDKNIYEKDVPKEVRYFFINDIEDTKKIERIREKKHNIFYKIYYNILLVRYRQKAKNTIKKAIKDQNIVSYLDFEGSSTRYIDRFGINKKIIRISNSISAVLGDRTDKIRRLGKRFNKYDKVLVLCDDMKKEMENIYPLLRNKIVRIYNPVDIDMIKKLSDDVSGLSADDRKKIGQKYIITVGRLNEYQKDVTTILRAYKIIKNNGIQDKLYIVGDGPDRDKLEKMAKDLGISDDVLFLGMRKDPYIWMKHAKLFVHSSKNEGLPNVLIEAIACGKMIISSDCPTGPREILDNETCGRLYKVGDHNRLAELLTEYLSDEKKIRAFDANIEKRKKVFDSKAIMKEYEQLLTPDILEV